MGHRFKTESIEHLNIKIGIISWGFPPDPWHLRAGAPKKVPRL